MYAAAEPVLERLDDVRWLAMLSANRGLVHVYLGRFDAARNDLERARDLYAQMGRASSSAEMVHNLAFLAMRQGDIPAALAELDEAEQRFRSLGLNVPVVLLDRAEALLLAGLSSDARDLAWAASERLAESRLEIERSEALLIHSQAALAANDYEAATGSATDACRLMANQGRKGWELRARYLTAAAQVAAGAVVDTADLAALASELDATGQLYAAFHTRLLAGRSALAAGDLGAAERELTRAGAVPAFAPVDVRVQAWLAKALLRRSQGDTRSAAAAVGAGVRLLESYRAMFGATESRVTVAVHAAELFELGLVMAAESGRPRRLLAWIERSRSGSLRAVRPRPPEDDRLARALADLRAAQVEAREAEVEGAFSLEMWRDQARLEREVRRLSLRQRGRDGPPARPPSLAAIQDQLGDRTMVVYAEIAGQFSALRIRPRSIRKFELGPADLISSQADRIRRAQRSLARQLSPQSVAAHQQGLTTAAGALDALLLAPLNIGGDGVVIVPPPALQSLPWSALPTCAGRTVVISPSAFAWQRAAAAANRSGTIVVVAGPGLEHAEAEVEEIAALYPDVRVLTGADATVAQSLRALDSASLAHFACHARFRSENAMFSSLLLADGELTVYDLETARRVPDVVVLSACDSGLSQTHAGEELTGLAAALLGMGARSLIVASSLVPDETHTRVLMRGLHERLSNGVAPAVALAEARTSLDADEPGGAVARDAFYCLGS